MQAMSYALNPAACRFDCKRSLNSRRRATLGKQNLLRHELDRQRAQIITAVELSPLIPARKSESKEAFLIESLKDCWRMGCLRQFLGTYWLFTHLLSYALDPPT